jgi:CheY-like chemotaxis protein
VEEIQKASDRAATLTQQLLAFSRRQVLQPRVLDLNVVVADIERILQRLIGEDVNLACFPGQALGRVLADPNQIEQVLMNLAVNARDAMPRGGRITIETQNVEIDDAAAARHVGMRPGPFVLLAVSDNGAGMDAETQAHIFDPFFTTKEQGKGTGLGLSTVYGIVKQSGGYIFVHSEVGRGTSFKIYLPRVERATDDPLPARVSPPLAGPAEETILLVEDEEMVRELVRQLLAQQGYTVLSASGGAEAITLCQRHTGPIHLLLTDVVMPQMSGQELSIFLASLHPETRVLYMSGYTDDAIVHRGVLQPGTAFIQKPFTPEALEVSIRRVLGSPRKPAS